jgi:hypothetical protein
MENQLTQIKDMVSIFKDIILALGVIVGGIWAYLKFKKLNVYRESILKIEELQKRLKDQPIINVILNASSVVGA